MHLNIFQNQELENMLLTCNKSKTNKTTTKHGDAYDNDHDDRDNDDDDDDEDDDYDDDNDDDALLPIGRPRRSTSCGSGTRRGGLRRELDHTNAGVPYYRISAVNKNWAWFASPLQQQVCQACSRQGSFMGFRMRRSSLPMYSD